MPLELQDSVIQKMSYFLPRDTRLELVDNLVATLGKPIPERISLETGIPKTHVYRYLPQHKPRRLAPDAKTTARMVKALLRNGGLQTVLHLLDPVEQEMKKTYHEYFRWKKTLRRYDIIPNPLSDTSIARLQRSLY